MTSVPRDDSRLSHEPRREQRHRGEMEPTSWPDHRRIAAYLSYFRHIDTPPKSALSPVSG